MATPGSTSLTSRAGQPDRPASPVATAATMSRIPGEVRAATCELETEPMVSGSGHDASAPSVITVATPASTQPSDRTTWLASPRTIPSAIPMMGTERGAMIMAPMTVAVESPRTPRPR
jgi:hypothetical protein